MNDEKQLPLTGRRREELQRKGDVARSQDVSSAILLAAALGVLLLLGHSMGRSIAEFMDYCFRAMGRFAPGKGGGGALVPLHLFLDLGLFMIMMTLAAIFSQVAQVGFIFSDRLFEPDINRINPLQGLQNLFSLRRLMTSLQGLLKLLFIVLACWQGARELLSNPVFVRPVSVGELVEFMVIAAWSIGWRCILALGMLAILDYAWQKWQFEKAHRMSFHEVKDEFRQTEGSIEVKRKRRLQARKLSLRRMFENLADSTIVITNPTHYAVALKYKRGITPAPVTVAKGQRLIALRIKKRCLELGIPAFENRSLAQGLYKHARVGEIIPSIYFQAVANMLAQLHRRGFQVVREAPAIRLSTSPVLEEGADLTLEEGSDPILNS